MEKMDTLPPEPEPSRPNDGDSPPNPSASPAMPGNRVDGAPDPRKDSDKTVEKRLHMSPGDYRPGWKRTTADYTGPAGDRHFKELWCAAYDRVKEKNRKNQGWTKYQKPTIQEVVQSMTELMEEGLGTRISELKSKVDEMERASSMLPWATVLSLLRVKLVEFLVDKDNDKASLRVTSDLLAAFVKLASSDPVVLNNFLSGSVGQAADAKENEIVLEDLLKRVKQQQEVLEVKKDARPA